MANFSIVTSAEFDRLNLLATRSFWRMSEIKFPVKFYFETTPQTTGILFRDDGGVSFCSLSTSHLNSNVLVDVAEILAKKCFYLFKRDKLKKDTLYLAEIPKNIAPNEDEDDVYLAEPKDICFSTIVSGRSKYLIGVDADDKAFKTYIATEELPHICAINFARQFMHKSEEGNLVMSETATRLLIKLINKTYGYGEDGKNDYRFNESIKVALTSKKEFLQLDKTKSNYLSFAKSVASARRRQELDKKAKEKKEEKISNGTNDDDISKVSVTNGKDTYIMISLAEFMASPIPIDQLYRDSDKSKIVFSIEEAYTTEILGAFFDYGNLYIKKNPEGLYTDAEIRNMFGVKSFISVIGDLDDANTILEGVLYD